MSVSGKDVMSGVDRRDKAMKDKLMSQFCRFDGMSRPVTPEYAEGWERIFGRKVQPVEVTVFHTVTDLGSDMEVSLLCVPDCPVCRVRDSEAPQTSHTSDE